MSDRGGDTDVEPLTLTDTDDEDDAIMAKASWKHVTENERMMLVAEFPAESKDGVIDDATPRKPCEPFELVPGFTMIGRGQGLGIENTYISRNQAEFLWDRVRHCVELRACGVNPVTLVHDDGTEDILLRSMVGLVRPKTTIYLNRPDYRCHIVVEERPVAVKQPKRARSAPLSRQDTVVLSRVPSNLSATRMIGDASLWPEADVTTTTVADPSSSDAVVVHFELPTGEVSTLTTCSRSGFISAIEGSIGAGKSTLTSYIGKRSEVHCVPEPLPPTSLLSAFYEDAKTWAFRIQLWFRYHRALQTLKTWQVLLEQDEEAPGRPLIVLQDRGTDGDMVFAELQVEDGNISKDELAVYEATGKEIDALLPAVSTIVVLDVPAKVCAERIKKRDRDGESNIPMAYLERLEDAHSRLISRLQASKSSHLVVDNKDIKTEDELETRASDVVASIVSQADKKIAFTAEQLNAARVGLAEIGKRLEAEFATTA